MKKISIIFLPILLIYLFVFLIKNDVPAGDGIRYANFAENLVNGFYAEKDFSRGFLWNGPGYPAVLSIFLIFGIPLKFASILNGLLLYFSSIILFRILQSFNNRFYFNLILAYFPFTFFPELIIYSNNIYTEPLVIFLLTLCFFILFKNKNSIYSIITLTLLSAFLIYIKLFLFYVLLVFSLALLLFKPDKKFILKYTLITLGLFSPYLIYTYSITDKLFYLSDSSSNVLYWTTNPNYIELGQWAEGNSENFRSTIKNKYSNLDSNLILKVDSILFESRYKNHKSVLDTIKTLNGLESDLYLKKISYRNIKENPTSFLRNIFFNFTRLFVGTPYYLYFKPPYTPILNVINIIKNSFLLSCFIISILVYIFNFKKINNRKIDTVLIFIIIYIIGIILVSNQSQRHLLPILPAITIIIGYIFSKIKFKIN